MTASDILEMERRVTKLEQSNADLMKLVSNLISAMTTQEHINETNAALNKNFNDSLRNLEDYIFGIEKKKEKKHGN